MEKRLLLSKYSGAMAAIGYFKWINAKSNQLTLSSTSGIQLEIL